MLRVKINVEDQGLKLRVAGCVIVSASVGYYCVTSGVRVRARISVRARVQFKDSGYCRVRTFSSTSVRVWVRLGLRLGLRLCKG